jgi:hypothetical protein
MVFAIGFFRSFFVNKWYGGTALAVLAGVVVACKRRNRTLLPVVLLAAYVFLYAFHIRSYYEMKSGLVEPQAALRFSMNFMALWAIVAGLGIGAFITSVARSGLWNRHRQLLIWSGGTVVIIGLIGALITTVRLREDEIEDEAISRLTPALSAIHFASLAGAQSDFIVTMEPLVIQMYADPMTKVVDYESADPDTLRALMNADKNSHLMFLKENDMLSDDNLARYGEQSRYLFSLNSTVLQRSDRFQILGVDGSTSH